MLMTTFAKRPSQRDNPAYLSRDANLGWFSNITHAARATGHFFEFSIIIGACLRRADATADLRFGPTGHLRRFAEGEFKMTEAKRRNLLGEILRKEHQPPAATRRSDLRAAALCFCSAEWLRQRCARADERAPAADPAARRNPAVPPSRASDRDAAPPLTRPRRVRLANALGPVDKNKTYFLFFQQNIDLVTMKTLRNYFVALIEGGVTDITLVVSSPRRLRHAGAADV